MSSISRRGFLKSSAVLAGAVSLSAVDGIALKSAVGSDGEFYQNSCGTGNIAQKKVLIAYASMHGSTGEVAGAIGKVLCDAGAAVDICTVKRVTDLSAYRAAVIGSAVRSERWLPEAKEFVASNRAVLSTIPTAYFLTCLTLAHSSAESRLKVQSFLDPVREEIREVTPFSTGLFAGVLDYNKYSTTIQVVMRYKMWTKGVDAGDYRNWQAIRAWAEQLKSTILAS